MVKDTAYEGGFTIVREYYASISKYNVSEIYDIKSKKYSKVDIPEEVAYTNKTEWEDRTWTVLAQGNFDNIIAIPISNEKKFLYSADKLKDKEVFCFQYDIIKDERKDIKKQSIINIVSNYLDINKNEIKNILLNDFLLNRDYLIFKKIIMI